MVSRLSKFEFALFIVKLIEVPIHTSYLVIITLLFLPLYLSRRCISWPFLTPQVFASPFNGLGSFIMQVITVPSVFHRHQIGYQEQNTKQIPRKRSFQNTWLCIETNSGCKNYKLQWYIVIKCFITMEHIFVLIKAYPIWLSPCFNKELILSSNNWKKLSLALMPAYTIPFSTFPSSAIVQFILCFCLMPCFCCRIFLTTVCSTISCATSTPVVSRNLSHPLSNSLHLLSPDHPVKTTVIKQAWETNVAFPRLPPMLIASWSYITLTNSPSVVVTTPVHFFCSLEVRYFLVLRRSYLLNARRRNLRWQVSCTLALPSNLSSTDIHGSADSSTRLAVHAVSKGSAETQLLLTSTMWL